jgi:RimJ/RimL family protein N-acetyltransferase
MLLVALTLADDVVRLVPLSHAHVPALVDAAAEDPGLYEWNVAPQGAAAMHAYVASALQGRDEGHMLPFAIERVADGRVVGSTRYCRIEHWEWPDDHRFAARATPDVVEVGHTWLARSAVRTAINTHAKLLLLSHAFDTWDVHLLRLRTDVRNARSRAAIERIGGRLDGIVRADRPAPDGAVRDSALYSITAAEWPDVRARLTEMAAAPLS